ncbi:MAG: ribonuclease P protein component [Taibaiella sp.]|nr:ribonuclease P protein component [Taibaiella sp.]
MYAIRYTFKAYERLKREQNIDTLFRTGKAFSVFPVRAIYHIVPMAVGEESPVRVGFSVPKKKFRKSVDRHRIARLMREVWRLNKHLVYEAVPPDKQVHLFFMFTDTTMPAMPAVHSAVTGSIAKLVQMLSPDA